MYCQSHRTSHHALILPMSVVFMMLCGHTQGWLWPLVGYSVLIWSCYRPMASCNSRGFWLIAAAGGAFLLLALTLKGRWQVLM